MSPGGKKKAVTQWEEKRSLVGREKPSPDRKKKAARYFQEISQLHFTADNQTAERILTICNTISRRGEQSIDCQYYPRISPPSVVARMPPSLTLYATCHHVHVNEEEKRHTAQGVVPSRLPTCQLSFPISPPLDLTIRVRRLLCLSVCLSATSISPSPGPATNISNHL